MKLVLARVKKWNKIDYFGFEMLNLINCWLLGDY